MGLGKTLQAICLMSYLKVQQMSPGPFCESTMVLAKILKNFVVQYHSPGFITFDFLSSVNQISAVVLCPLSVTDGWVSEMDRFSSKLRVLRYVGDKEHRRGLRRRIYEQVKEGSSQNDVSFDLVRSFIDRNKSALVFGIVRCCCHFCDLKRFSIILSIPDCFLNWVWSQVLLLPFDVLLTTYDIALMDQDFLSQIPWHYAVIDEAQRLKNPSSVCLISLDFSFQFTESFICNRGLPAY